MNLNDYFDPVELDKPDDYFISDSRIFGKNIRINTLSHPVEEISNYKIAILGVPEDRNSYNRGAAQAPDKIRNKLYQLYKVNDKENVIDLGNLKQGVTYTDTYFALRDVILELLNNQVIAIVLGGTQDLTRACYTAFEKFKSGINVVSIDSTIDLGNVNSGSDNHLTYILGSNLLFNFTNIGHQQYLTSPENIDEVERLNHHSFRLGMFKNRNHLIEPFLRDADLLSIDIGAVKQGDAPGRFRSSPNGFAADEICQISRYAGLSDRLSVFGIFEINPENDRNDQTHHLAAQMIWYFIEGFGNRKTEMPESENRDFKIFIVSHNDMEHDITFVKSLKTERWWMEVPRIDSGTSLFISASYEDYQQACNHDIPDIWWKTYQKINHF